MAASKRVLGVAVAKAYGGMKESCGSRFLEA
jgi:hypothetical protein